MIHSRFVLAWSVALVAGCTAVGTSSVTPQPLTAGKGEARLPSYAETIRAAIRLYIVLTESVEGNPAAEVKVTTRPDGEVLDAEVVKSSGNAHWDQAARIAVLKAGRIPPDANGKVPPVLYISFRPLPG